MEVRSGDPRFPLVANEAAKLIEAAVERLGYEVDEAVCIMAQVAADYARATYGSEYLSGLAKLVTARGTMPLPAKNDVNSPSDEGASAGTLPPDEPKAQAKTS